jgi:hypothetical protein
MFFALFSLIPPFVLLTWTMILQYPLEHTPVHDPERWGRRLVLDHPCEGERTVWARDWRGVQCMDGIADIKDFTISVAAIHHLSTPIRRRQAVQVSLLSHQSHSSFHTSQPHFVVSQSNFEL